MKIQGHFRGFLLCSVVFGSVSMVLFGCSGRPAKEEPRKPPAAPMPMTDEGPKDRSGPATGLAELSDEDRAQAEKQKVCPVSGETLGEHGKPYKITVKDQVVFLCCSGCEEMIKKDPDKYLAKLKAREAKWAAPRSATSKGSRSPDRRAVP